MARVTITAPNARALVNSNRVSWFFPANSRISLGTSLSQDGSTEIFLALIEIPRASSNSVSRIILAPNQTSSDSAAGPDFSNRMENSGTITITASNGNSLTLTGINDAAEPYIWVTPNAAAARTFANTVAGLSDKSVTIVFDDGLTPPFLTAKHNGKAATAAKYNGQAISKAKYNNVTLL